MNCFALYDYFQIFTHNKYKWNLLINQLTKIFKLNNTLLFFKYRFICIPFLIAIEPYGGYSRGKGLFKKEIWYGTDSMGGLIGVGAKSRTYCKLIINSYLGLLSFMEVSEDFEVVISVKWQNSNIVLVIDTDIVDQ